MKIPAVHLKIVIIFTSESGSKMCTEINAKCIRVGVALDLGIHH